MDKITAEHRSWNMSRIRSRDTKPEVLVRSILHNMGFRFRLNGVVSKKIYSKGILPGKPDIVLIKYKTIIFVHGCFWHQHEGCNRANIPKSNQEYWIPKLLKNKERDLALYDLLNQLGWKVIVIWECELKSENIDVLKSKLKKNIQ
jgi:DNA mismatch endonuclease (patch repair protein)